MASFKAFLLTSILAYTLTAHECHFNSYEHPPEFLDIEEDTTAFQGGRFLASAAKMRIYAHYDYLVSSASSSLSSYIKNDLAPAVISYFQAALKIKAPVSGKLTLGSSASTICGQKTPSVLKNGVNADYFIMFTSKSESSNVVASSRYCYLASGTKRPLIAMTSFNRPKFSPPNGDELLHEKNIYLLMHEMMHTFGISDNTYQYFIDENGKTRKDHIKSVTVSGSKRKVIDVPELTSRIRKFYGCSSIPGLILENGGGSGTADSHLERKFFIYEAMSSGGIYGRRISEFSLGLLEASGWYIADYDYAEPYFFGQGQGCDFVNDKCSTSKAQFDEFCVGSSRGCAAHGRGGGKCSSDSIADGCKYVDPNVNYDCDNDGGKKSARFSSAEVYGRGSGSKCFTGNLYSSKTSSTATSFCFKYDCSGSGSSTELKVILGSTSVTCEKKGKMSVNGYSGTIDCPDPLEFCSTVGKQYCPRNCLGRGTCVNNKCKCDSGYKGIDCNERD